MESENPSTLNISILKNFFEVNLPASNIFKKQFSNFNT